jgi:hypothetical protein
MNDSLAATAPMNLQVPPEMVDEISSALAEAGATDVDISQPQAGFDPITITVIAVLAVSAIGDVVMRIRAKRQCRQIIDARNGEVKTKLECAIKDGRIIVIAGDGDKVEIADVPDGVDLGKVIEAAKTGGAAKVKEAAGL